MKRLLIPLLAALALPTAVNAEVVNLECESLYLDWHESRKRACFGGVVEARAS